MDVVIKQFGVTAHSERPAEPRGGAPAQSNQLLDHDDFLSQYGALLREFIRNEIERYLRHTAD